MSLNNVNDAIEKIAFKKAVKAGLSGAVLGAGLKASSAYDKNKDSGDPNRTMASTVGNTMLGAGLGMGGGIAVNVAGRSIKNKAIGIGRNIAKLKKYAEEEKTAGVIKAMAIPAALGGILSSEKANDVAKNNPYLSEEDTNRYVAGKRLQGGAVGAGLGLGAYKLSKLPSKIVKGIAKKADLKVPDTQELSDDEAVVKESPNEKEIREMVEPITEESIQRNKYKDLIEKTALESTDGYLKPINCENCGYKGLPKSDSGACPECGTLGGKVSYPSLSVEVFDPDSRERNLNTVWEMDERERQERLSYYR